jgi:hypothetical protein
LLQGQLLRGKQFLALAVQFWQSEAFSFSSPNGCASFPPDVALRAKSLTAWQSTIRKCFLIQTPYLHCIAVCTTVEEMDVYHSCKRVVFGLHHEPNSCNRFNCFELNACSYCFMEALSDHVTLLTHLFTGYELLHSLPYPKRYSM